MPLTHQGAFQQEAFQTTAFQVELIAGLWTVQPGTSGVGWSKDARTVTVWTPDATESTAWTKETPL